MGNWEFVNVLEMDKYKHLTKCPNSSNRTNKYPVDIIVNHITAGWAAEDAVNIFMNDSKNVSTHFVVENPFYKRSSGRKIYVVVDPSLRAWGNGTSTASTSTVYNGKSTDPTVRERNINANDYTISIEFVAMDANAFNQYPTLYDEYLEAFKEIVDYLNEHTDYKFNKVLNHCDVAPQTKPNCKMPFTPEAHDYIQTYYNDDKEVLDEEVEVPPLYEEKTMIFNDEKVDLASILIDDENYVMTFDLPTIGLSMDTVKKEDLTKLNSTYCIKLKKIENYGYIVSWDNTNRIVKITN